MNESILRALMQLFAIITDIREEIISGAAKDLVKKYLEKNLNRDYVRKYLKLFEDYLKEYHYDSLLGGDEAKIQKETALNSIKILKICSRIIEELELEPRLLVILELLEFIKKEKSVTRKELDFVDIIAYRLNLNEADYENIKAFTYDSIEKVPDKSKLLVIDSNKEFKHQVIKHHTNERLLGQIYVLHVSSTNTLIFHYNGTDTLFLNGHHIDTNRCHILSIGSLIKSSRIKPIYYTNVISKFILDKSAHPIKFIAKGISFRFPNSTDGLHKFNLEESSGRLIGIMGSSGTGKSTMLNVLNGNLKLYTGEININGYDLHKDSTILHGLIGFVPQDDLLIEELTVFQNLYYNAKLCFSGYSHEKITEIVEKALKNFDLVEARDLKVGNPLNKIISGGQRKRLNIALELVREPAILFVDEPTSGLSSNDSEKVMYLLKRQTLKGKMVLVNIHQPSSDLYKLFDRIIIMDIGGRVVYNGNPMDAITYFKQEADFVNPGESECLKCGNIQTDQPLKILEARIVDNYGRLVRKRKTEPEEWYIKYLKNSDSNREPVIPKEKKELPSNLFKRPSLLNQFRIFLTRDVLSKLNNKQYLLISFFEAPVLAFILGYFTKFIKGTIDNPHIYIFSENKNLPAYIFMSVIVALFIGLVTSAEEIIKDRRISKRESFLHLSRFSYLNSKIVQMFIISAVQTFTYSTIGNMILGVQDMTFYYWFALFSASCFMNLAGLIISSAFNSVVTIYILIPFMLVPQILFSGTIVNFTDLHQNISSPKYVPIIGDLMASRWVYEALMVNQFKNNKYERHFYRMEQKMSESDFYLIYYIPRLETKLDKYIYNSNISPSSDENDKNGLFIKSNTEKMCRLFSSVRKVTLSYDIDTLNRSVINVDSVKLQFELMKGYFNNQRDFYSKQKEDTINALITEFGKERIQELNKNYHNQYVENFVTDRYNIEKLIEKNNELIQLKDPIFHVPDSKIGRAHFYAPYKNFLGLRWETYQFNMSLVWVISFIMYLALHFDVLSKLIKRTERFRFRSPASTRHKRV